MKNSTLKFKSFFIKNRYLLILISAFLAAAITAIPIVLLVPQQDAELTKIEIISAPIKTQYIEKQFLDTEGLVVMAHFGKKSAEITDYSVDKTILNLNDTEVNVSYTHDGITKSASFGITVTERALTAIEITHQPESLIFTENTAFNAAGLEVTAVYNNGERAVITDYVIDKTILNINDSAVAVSYTENGITESALINITVVKRQLTAIEITKNPNRTSYIENTAFNTAGLEVTAVYNNGERAVITDYNIDKSVLIIGDKSVMVSFTENGITKTAEIDIKVTEKSLYAIEITRQPNKLSYIERTHFDSTGLILTAIYDNGETAAVTEYFYDKIGLLKTTDAIVKIGYTEKGITKYAEIAITVSARSVERIEIVNPPSKREYLENTFFDPAGLTVKAYYDNGEEEYVSGWEYDNRPLSVTDENVTITFSGKSAAVSVSVNPKILTAITASGFPQKITYIEGEYFDFLGAEIYAVYANAPTELINDWDYDIKEPLKTSDTEITIFYTLHGITKAIIVPITVSVAPQIDAAGEIADEVIGLLPPTEQLTADNLDSIDYALSVLNGLTNPTPEQSAKKAELETKREEIAAAMPPAQEREYLVSYELANGLKFNDIYYGDNPRTFKNSGGAITLKAAKSDEAAALGYKFNGWLIGGKAVDSLADLSGDVTVYAVFEISTGVDLVFIDYESSAELYRIADVGRTSEFDFESSGASSAIYSRCGKLPAAYCVGGKRVSTADLSIGAEIIVSVITADSREVHLADGNSVTVAWKYSFNVGSAVEIAEKAPNTGTVFVIPIGAEAVFTALNANISDILIDGVSKGEILNNTVVAAKIMLTAGEYPVAVTFKTVITDVATLSFIGRGQHSVIYPKGWDGYIAAVDLERIEFYFDESNENYISIYTIDGKDYYFGDLANYKFNGDTEIRVTRVRNSFALIVYYDGGIEKIEGLKGRQALKEALSALDTSALSVLNSILKDGLLYTDSAMSVPIAADELLGADLRHDIIVFSDWIKPAPPTPTPPDFGAVDYEGQSHVNTWRSMFASDGGDILSSELTLTADGLYTYKTYINGKASADISGIYRVENGRIAIKTFVLNYDYQIISAEDIYIDVAFASDNLLRANFIKIVGTEKTVFEHTLTCRNIKPINYTGMDFIGEHSYNGALIELRANGTAVITRGIEINEVYYRVSAGNTVIVFDNGAIGTGEIIGLIGGNL